MVIFGLQIDNQLCGQCQLFMINQQFIEHQNLKLGLDAVIEKMNSNNELEQKNI